MMTDRDFHDDRSRFSWWQVEIFIMTSRHFNDDRSRFSWWQVKIFMLTDWDFRDDRSRFPWWQVTIFMMTGDTLLSIVEISMMRGRDFHDDRSRFYYERSRFSWQVEVFLLVPGVTQGKESAGCVYDFIFLFLVLIKKIRRLGESKIPLLYPSDGKLPPQMFDGALNTPLIGKVL